MGRLTRSKPNRRKFICDCCGKTARRNPVAMRFRVDGVDKENCMACTQIMYDRLQIQLLGQGKTVKMALPKDKNDKAIIVLTDASDYISIKLVTPESTLITSKTNPELFRSQKEIDGIKSRFTPPGVLIPNNPIIKES